MSNFLNFNFFLSVHSLFLQSLEYVKLIANCVVRYTDKNFMKKKSVIIIENERRKKENEKKKGRKLKNEVSRRSIGVHPPAGLSLRLLES